MAAAAVFANLHWFAAHRPGTPLRVLSLIAIDAAQRSRGIALSPESRTAVIEAMEFGALLNDRFDGGAHDPAALRASISWFTRSPHRETARNYAKRLRRLERNRPGSQELPDPVRLYREDVNRLSLAFLWALAGSANVSNAEFEIENEPDLRLLLGIVMLFQVIDDVVDFRQDFHKGLPSFATASGATAASLRELISSYSTRDVFCFDRNFCLQVAVRIVALAARGIIGIRFSGNPPELN